MCRTSDLRLCGPHTNSTVCSLANSICRICAFALNAHIINRNMVLVGSIAVVTRQQAPAVDAAVAQLKKTNAFVTDVVLLSVAADASVAQTVVAAGTANAFDAVIAFNEETAMLSTELQALAPIVKAGGALHVYVADASEDKKVCVCTGTWRLDLALR